MSQDPNFSAKVHDMLSAADPALMITEEELNRSRERSLSFMDSDVTHIAVGGSIHDFHRAPAKRRWGRLAVAGLGAVAAVAASVLVASSFGTAPVNTAAASVAANTSPTQSTPTGPLRDLFLSADEVLVIQALPNTAVWQEEYKSFMSKLGQPGGPAYGPPGLGVEPVNVLQVLKGTRATGRGTLDVVAMPDAGQWKNTNIVAPLTYLAFIKKGPDGIGHLMSEPHALLQILNLRTAAIGDPVSQQPVEIGADLRSRIAVAPTGDVPLATYEAAAGSDVIREGIFHGHISASEACFTFQSSAEKVVLRWPAGYTAATRSLPQDANGDFRIDGPSHGDRAVVLNKWGTVYSFDTWALPQITGNRTGEKAVCDGQSLPVFDIAPSSDGASPFQLTHGAAGPSPQQ
jgi:hypothetical protein